MGRSLGDRTSREDALCPLSVRKVVLAPGDNLCVGDPGKLIFLCRGLQTKFPRNVV